jgi:hypothetical protein
MGDQTVWTETDNRLPSSTSSFASLILLLHLAFRRFVVDDLKAISLFFGVGNASA